MVRSSIIQRNLGSQVTEPSSHCHRQINSTGLKDVLERFVQEQVLQAKSLNFILDENVLQQHNGKNHCSS